jgi:superfamily II helicase
VEPKTPQELKALGERVLQMLLEDFESILSKKTATPTDRATIARFLKDNDYTIDPKNLPKELKDMLRRNGARSLPDVDGLPISADMAVIDG